MQKNNLLLIFIVMNLYGGKADHSRSASASTNVTVTKEPRQMTMRPENKIIGRSITDSTLSLVRSTTAAPCSLCACVCNGVADCADNSVIKTCAIIFRSIACKIKGS